MREAIPWDGDRNFGPCLKYTPVPHLPSSGGLTLELFLDISPLARSRVGVTLYAVIALATLTTCTMMQAEEHWPCRSDHDKTEISGLPFTDPL